MAGRVGLARVSFLPAAKELTVLLGPGVEAPAAAKRLVAEAARRWTDSGVDREAEEQAAMAVASAVGPVHLRVRVIDGALGVDSAA
jgi:hypothetical protein